MFCKFFLFKSNELDRPSFSRKNRLRFSRAASEFDFGWPVVGSFAGCAGLAHNSIMGAIWQDPVLSKLPKWAFSEVFDWRDGERERHSVGVVVKQHVRYRENLFAALLGFARKNGLSIADPHLGLLLLTPATAVARNPAWMRLRKIDILDWLLKTLHPGPSGLLSLCEQNAESFFAFVAGGRYGVPAGKTAVSFRNALKESLYPDERLELFRGRVVVAGPDGSYRIHFNWEGCGKHSGWTADFSDPACPIVPLLRISTRLLKKQAGGLKAVPPGMFDPRIVERIPDPADRYASLVLGNRKLRDRVPRAILEEAGVAVEVRHREQEARP